MFDFIQVMKLRQPGDVSGVTQRGKLGNNHDAVLPRELDQLAHLGFAVSMRRGDAGNRIKLQRATLIVGEMPMEKIDPARCGKLDRAAIVRAIFQAPRTVEHQPTEL
jgi:hypothetical protein